MNALLKKYKSMPIQAKAVFWFTFCGFFQKGISVITIPLFTRLVPQEQYGLFNVFSAWQGILVIFATLNLQTAIMNAFLKFPDRKRIISAFQGLSMTVSLFILVLYFIFRDFWDSLIGLSSLTIVVMLFSFLFVSPLIYWTVYKRYVYEYRGPVIITILSSVLIPLVSCISILNTSAKGDALIYSYLAVTIVIGIFLFLYNQMQGKCFYDKELWKYAFFFALPLIPHNLSEIVLNQSDRIMIEHFSNTVNVSIYGLAYSAASIITIFLLAINTVFVPWQYQKLQTKSFGDLSKMANYVLTFAAALLLLLMMFAPEVVILFSTPDYYDAIYLIPPISLGLYFNYMYQLFFRVELYFEKRNGIAIASILAALANIGLNIILIPIFGYQVAAYTTLICYLLLCITHYIFYYNLCKQNFDSQQIYNIKYILGISIVLIILSFMILLTYQNTLIRYGTISIVVIILFFQKNKLLQLYRTIKSDAS